MIVPGAGLLDLLGALRAAVADPETLRTEIRTWRENPAASSLLGRIADRLLVDPDDLRELLENADAVLALIYGTVADLHRRSWTLPLAATLERAGDARIETWSGATVEGDADGNLFDGLLRFDRKRLGALRIGVRAAVTPTLRATDAFRETAASAAFGAGAEIVVDNIFLHDRDEPAFDALRSDLARFVLPWQTDALLRLDQGPATQIVHLGGSGRVEIGGRLRWRSASITRLGFDGFDATLAVTPAVSADARYSAWLQGDFHVLVESAPSGLTLRLGRSSTSRASGRVAAAAEIGVRGLAPLAREILDELVGDLDAVVESVAAGAARWSDLQALFRAEADEAVEDLLGSERVTRQIEEWLRAIGVRIEVRRRVRALVARTAGERLAEAIDRLEEDIAPAVEAVRRAIAPLHETFRRAHAAIDAAARARIGVTLARSASRRDERSAVFVLDVDRDRAPEILPGMLRGRFADALERAEQEESGVVLRERAFAEAAVLETRSGLDLTILGRRVGVESIAAASWESEVSATGEVVIAVESSLERQRRAWRAMRSVAMRIERDALAFEAAIEFEPTEAELRAHEKAMIELGILDGPIDMLQELPIDAKRFALRPFGKLESAAALRLSRKDVRAITEGQLPLARGTFARRLSRWAPPPAPFLRRRGTDRLPLFAWPSALVWAGEPLPETHRTLRFADSTGAVRIDVPEGAPLRMVMLYARTVLVFEKLLLALRTWGEHTGDDTLTRLRAEQRALLRDAAPLLEFPSSAVGYAVVAALLDLLPPAARPDTSLVILREDRQRFVW